MKTNEVNFMSVHFSFCLDLLAALFFDSVELQLPDVDASGGVDGGRDGGVVAVGVGRCARRHCHDECAVGSVKTARNKQSSVAADGETPRLTDNKIAWG